MEGQRMDRDYELYCKKKSSAIILSNRDPLSHKVIFENRLLDQNN